MSEGRREILEMLSTGRISADEAERLLAALESQPGAAASAGEKTSRPKYLRVVVDDAVNGGKGPMHVNVRVPLQLLRAGVRLASVIPLQARDKVNVHLGEHGVGLDLSQIKPENLDELIDQLTDLTVDVDETQGAKVRLFCE